MSHNESDSSPVRGAADEQPRAVLNLGAGAKHIEGAVNLDITPVTNPEVVHDLDDCPWPFEDASFDEIHAYDVLEHVREFVPVMLEIARVSRAGATFRVTVPHFSCANAFTDPTHRRFFGFHSLDYFTEGHEFSFYSSARFKIRSRRIIFKPSLSNKLVWRLASRYPDAYENRWAWIFPAWFLFFELEVVKG